MSVTIQLRRDTAANWLAADPVLAQGEVGIEYDTRGMKVGDGVSAWTALHYVSAVESVAGRTGQVVLTAADVAGLGDALAGKADLAGGRLDPDQAPDVSWDDLSDRPAVFPPSPHQHPVADVSGLSDALGAKQDSADKGVAFGYAGLDGAGKIPASQLPASVMEFKGTWDARTNTPVLADGVGDAGDVYRVSAAGAQNLGSGDQEFRAGDWVTYSGTIWQRSGATDVVLTVAGKTGDVVLVKDDVGLSAVDNTADADKPVSTAAALALGAKADAERTVTAGTGLTGGGDLSADRTLSVAFGSTTGKVCAGDDQRLSDARTPSDSSVTNAKVAANAGIALSKLATGYVQGSADGDPSTTTLWRGTQAQYDAIVTKDPDTIYFVKD